MGGRRDCGVVKILVWQVDAETDVLHCERYIDVVWYVARRHEGGGDTE